MTVDQLLSYAYKKTGTTSNQIPDMLEFMNISYHDLVETIKNEVDPDFYYDYWTTDIVADQNEYTLQVADNDTIGVDKVSQVGVMYKTTDTVYTMASFDDPVNFNRTPEYYESYQLGSNPIYLIRENSIFIYPTPTVSVTNGLRVHGIYTPIDLVLGGSEASIKLPRQFHEGIAMGARRDVYAMRSMNDKETDAINKFEQFKRQMVESLRERVSEPIRSRVPSLSGIFD